jgi:ATP-dependent DNA helicase DinG
MARLVARALRLGRSALIQTGSTYQSYRLSYLAPALIWPGAAIVVAPASVQQWLLRVEIPRLQEWMGTDKPIHCGDRFPEERFPGLLITSPQAWLTDRLEARQWFPANIPTLIDGADDLEQWARGCLKGCIQPGDWDELMLARPKLANLIRDVRVKLTKLVFQHPPNPYECYPIAPQEQELVRHLFAALEPTTEADGYRYLPAPWQHFWQGWQRSEPLMWAEVARSQGQFSLYCEPLEVASALSQVWSQQPTVLIGKALDLETTAPVYRQQLGLGDLTCLKFSPDRHSQTIQLYLPDGLPMPNSPHFREALIQQVRTLVTLSADAQGPAVLVVGDVPLRSQLGAVLAAEFGSRVRVEKTELDEQGILVTGWEFWRTHQARLPTPQLLAIATLPIPSLEHPLVAGQVAYYKQQRLDWFRLYLLPTALRELQRAIAPVRESQGVVALLDNRVNHRSYGHQVLCALSPFARINYLEASWFRSGSSFDIAREDC